MLSLIALTILTMTPGQIDQARGERAFRAARYSEALSYFEKSERHGNKVSVWLQAMALVELDRPEEAVERFYRAVKLAGRPLDLPILHLYRASACYTLGMVRCAESALDQFGTPETTEVQLRVDRLRAALEQLKQKRIADPVAAMNEYEQKENDALEKGYPVVARSLAKERALLEEQAPRTRSAPDMMSEPLTPNATSSGGALGHGRQGLNSETTLNETPNTELPQSPDGARLLRRSQPLDLSLEMRRVAEDSARGPQPATRLRFTALAEWSYLSVTPDPSPTTPLAKAVSGPSVTGLMQVLPKGDNGPYGLVLATFHRDIAITEVGGTNLGLVSAAAGWHVGGENGPQLAGEFGAEVAGIDTGHPNDSGLQVAQRVNAVGGWGNDTVWIEGAYLARFNSFLVTGQPTVAGQDHIFQINGTWVFKPGWAASLIYRGHLALLNGSMALAEHGPRLDLTFPIANNWRTQLATTFFFRSDTTFDETHPATASVGRIEGVVFWAFQPRWMARLTFLLDRALGASDPRLLGTGVSLALGVTRQFSF